jgi:hypothetical protein
MWRQTRFLTLPGRGIIVLFGIPLVVVQEPGDLRLRLSKKNDVLNHDGSYFSLAIVLFQFH